MPKGKKNTTPEVIRPHVEQAYADEIKKIQALDKSPKPVNWSMSPKAVVQFIIGGDLDDGTKIVPKYIGDKSLVEMAVATLLTDRALLLSGIPGTAKSRLAEFLATAISGKSTYLVQGTAGLYEDALRYGWNYAMLLAKGPSKEAMVPSPVMAAMMSGSIVRIEELTRIPSDVQDALITVLSEKILPIPELNSEVSALQGFNVIATANERDRGVNELSGALRRRFNVVRLPLPEKLETEVAIVRQRVEEMASSFKWPEADDPSEEIKRVITIFRELREGKTIQGDMRLRSSSATLSTAEAISVINNAQALATHFGSGKITAKEIIPNLKGVIIKDKKTDEAAWNEYLETVIRTRNGWEEYYEEGKK